MVDLEEIKSKVLEGIELETVLGKISWNEFESFVAEIFRDNGFFVKQNFRFKTKSRYEIDVIAIKDKLIFCVDCKEWSAGRYKKSGLKNAVKNQEIRMAELKKFMKNNIIAKGMLNVPSKYDLHTLIVTLLEEDLIKEYNTTIVPAWKLNSFLLGLQNYLE